MLNFLNSKELIDTHCHLNDSSYDDDRDDVVKRAIENGLKAIVDIGIDIKSSRMALENSQKYEGIVYAFAGIDPEVFIPRSSMFEKELFEKDQIEIGKWISSELEKLEDLLNSGKFSGVGECGLDYYWISRNEELDDTIREKSKRIQKLLFASQVELAIKYRLPLSIHSRGAEDECIEMIRIFKSNLSKELMLQRRFTGSFHSFTGTVKQAKEIVELGFKIGINGIVTYSSAEEIRKIVKTVGRENIVLETDGPFLVPSDSKTTIKGRNEPSTIKDIDNYLFKSVYL